MGIFFLNGVGPIFWPRDLKNENLENSFWVLSNKIEILKIKVKW